MIRVVISTQLQQRFSIFRFSKHAVNTFTSLWGVTIGVHSVEHWILRPTVCYRDDNHTIDISNLFGLPIFLIEIFVHRHLKVTAAVSACISEYLLAQGIDNWRDYLQSPTSDFHKTNVFLLYTADISGIQKFIYTVTV